MKQHISVSTYKYILSRCALSFLFFLCAHAQTTISEIFVPSVYMEFDSTSNTMYYRQIAIAKNAGLVFYKQGMYTLLIIDESDNHKIIYTFSSKFEIKDNFLVTDDGTHITLIVQNLLTIFSFNKQTLSMTQLFQDTVQSQFSIIQLNYKQTKIYLVRDQTKFQIVSLSNFSFQTGSLDQALQVLDLHISQDESWFCISGDSGLGLFFYSISILNTSVSLTLVASSNVVDFYTMLFLKNESYLIGVDYWQGVSIFNLATFLQQVKAGNTNISISPTVLMWWMTPNGEPYSSALVANVDETQILMGARSVGIYVIDITQISSPRVFQLIQLQNDIRQLLLSKDNSFLYLSTKKSVYIFQKDKANLQNSYPNLYNKHQSQLANILNTPYAWRSIVLQDNKHLIVTCSNTGLIITQFDSSSISQPLTILSKISYPFITYSDNIMLFRNEQFLMVPVQDPAGFILDIYDITNKSSPLRVQRIPSSNSGYIYSFTKNQAETLFVCQNVQQILFYSITGSIQFSLLTTYNVPSSLTTAQTNDMVILEGFPYIILLFRAILIASLNINDLQNPFIAEQIDALGAEQIVQGTYLTNYCFIGDGLQGVSVIDLLQLPKIVIVSNVPIGGYTNFQNLILSDRYIITSQLTGGQTALVTFNDINSPQFISQLQFKNEFAAASSVTSDHMYLFLITGGGVRIVPISSPQFLIHYEFQQIITQSTGVVQKVRLPQNNQILKVGQTIQISLNPLYPIQSSQITNAYFLSDGVLKSIPSWMSFDNYLSTLTLSVTKDSLNSISTINDADKYEITYQTVVFVTKLTLQSSSFSYTDSSTGTVVISAALSQQIFISYKEMGILNNLNQVSDQFAQDESFSPYPISGVTLSDDAMAYIQRKLALSMNYSPIQLQLSKSLVINLMNSSQYISSQSQSANMFLTIDTTKGKFVNKLYPSVVTSLSDKQDQINFQGDVSSLNELLIQKIQIYLYNKEDLNVTIQIQVSDGINNDYANTFTLNNITHIFLMKQSISIPQANKLQTQVSNQFSGSSIYINTQNSIEFSLETFSNTNFNSITLQAYILQDDSSVPITSQNSNIQFTPQQFKFYIKTSMSDFNRKYCFQVNATDSYSWIADSFCVTSSVISFEVFLNIFIQVIGPLLFFLGVFKYWNRIFNAFFYKRNICGVKEIYENTQFVQKFIVVNDSYLIGSRLFNEFKKSLRQEENLQKSVSKDFSMKVSGMVKSSYIKQNSRMDNQLKILDEGSPFFRNLKENLIEEKNIKFNQLLNKTIRQLSLKTSNINQSYSIFEKYITKKHSIDSRQFVTDLFNANLPITYQRQILKPIEFQHELNDTGSVLYNCISGLLMKELLKMNKRSYIVYLYIREVCKLQNISMEHLWVQQIARPNHILKQKKYNEEQIIPDFEIDHLFLKKTLHYLIKNSNKSEDFGTKQLPLTMYQDILDIDLQLIIHCIIADAIGIITPSQKSLYPNSGESIHLLEHQIKKVQALMKTKNSKTLCLRRLFNMEYVPLFSRKNQQLPGWLKIKIERQLITLYGSPPQSSHYSKIKINVFDNNECIVREFILKLKSSKRASGLNLTNDEDINLDSQEFVNNLSSPKYNFLVKSPPVQSPKESDMMISDNPQTHTDMLNRTESIPYKQRFKMKLFQINNSESPDLFDQSSIINKNMYQLSRKITKSINPLVQEQSELNL